MQHGAVNRPDPGIKSIFTLLQLNDARSLYVPIAAVAGALPVRQRNSVINSDIVVVVIVPHKCSHHIFHFPKSGEHSGIYFRRTDSFIAVANGGWFSDYLSIFRQRNMKKCKGGIRFAAIQRSVTPALLPVPVYLVKLYPVVITDGLVRSIGVGVNEIEQCFPLVRI